MTCPSCGTDNPASHHFCGQCGTVLGAPAAARVTEERKLATVLFADLVGFTGLAEDADPEAIAGRVEAAFRQMTTAVTSHGGTVDKFMGDCLMAVFGVPAAHDDDAERAIAAALAMQRVLAGDLPFSVGINTGDVLVTAVGGEGGMTVIGDAVNVAARLEKVAGPGQILIGPLTAELARDRVTLRPRPPVVLKGRRQAVEAWEAIAVERQHERAVTTPLVGRDDELAFLLAQWRRCRDDDRSSVVVLTGAAGVGKTRLLDALAEAVVLENGRVARASHPAYASLGGMQLVTDLIDDLGPSADLVVEARVRSLTGDLHPSLRGLDANALKREQHWAFRRLIGEKAAAGPLLIVVDDIHRAGTSMIELTADLVRGAGSIPLLVVLAGRPDDGWAQAFTTATVLRLDPLGPAAAATFAASLGTAPSVDVGALVERSGGNPLYLRELVTMAAATGPAATVLPPGLHAILAARLDALDGMAKLALQHLAVLGGKATSDELAALGPDGVGAGLQTLAMSGLVVPAAEGVWRVADPLLGEVAYETLPHRARAELHRRAAGVMETSVGRARHLEQAAAHDPGDEALAREAAAALAEAALEHLERAGMTDGVRLMERAVALGHDEPADLLELARRLNDAERVDDALAVLDRLPAVPAGSRLEAERIHVEAYALITRDPEAALRRFDEAIALWAGLGDTEKEGWAHANKALAWFASGRLDLAGAELDEGLDRFLRVGSREGEFGVYRILHVSRPDDPRVPAWMGEALRHAAAVGDRTSEMASLHGLAWYHFLRARLGGDADHVVAEAYARATAELGRDIDAPMEMSQGLVLRSNLARMAGRLEDALALAEQAARPELPPDTTDVELQRAVLFSATLALDPTASIPVPGVTSLDPRAAAGFLIVVEALLLAGRVEDAAAAVDRRTGPGLGTIEVLSSAVQVALAEVVRSEFAAARYHLGQALAAAEACEARPAVAAVRALLAEVSAREGDRAGAVEHLARIPAPAPGGLAAALALRARAAMGDEGVGPALAAEARRLGAPVLLAGLG